MSRFAEPVHVSTTPYLRAKSILDLAVDRAKLIDEQLLSLIHEATADDTLARHLVAAVRNDIGVVGGATTIPGKELVVSVSFSHCRTG